MVKRTGNAKIIDIGSAMDLDQAWHGACGRRPSRSGSTRRRQEHAAIRSRQPRLRPDRDARRQSPFEGLTDYRSLLAAKKDLDKRLKSLLPDDVGCNEMLIHLCQKLIAPDPARRFPDAQAGRPRPQGRRRLHRQLVKGDWRASTSHDLRLWLEELN